ncbi:uncharacterized protein [Chiloscyllium punctatum]|uniref:uncharacterized protein n=1 Tax=Chiloscyllium punctatum TaxID=137246 RepID=UPI003B641E94
MNHEQEDDNSCAEIPDPCQKPKEVTSSFTDTMQEEFMSIQKVLQAFGKECAVLHDSGTQTEKCGRPSKGKQKTMLCSLSTQTDLTYQDIETVYGGVKLLCSIGTQTESKRHCKPTKQAVKEEPGVSSENKIQQQRLESQLTDSDEQSHKMEDRVQSSREDQRERLKSELTDSDLAIVWRNERLSSDGSVQIMDMRFHTDSDNVDLNKGFMVQDDDLQIKRQRSFDSDDQLSRKVSKLSADVGVQTKQLKSTSDTSIHRERSDAIVQTKETRLPTFESDKDHVQQSRALLNDASTQTMESENVDIAG